METTGDVPARLREELVGLADERSDGWAVHLVERLRAGDLREERRHLEARRQAIEELTRQLWTAAVAAADTVNPAVSRAMSREVS